jgi:GNAT superfamily N-acetyltransferase
VQFILGEGDFFMNTEYKKIDDLILGRLINKHGEHLKQEIIIRSDTFALAPMDGDDPIGWINVAPRTLAYPLEHIKDAYIETLWVDESYRRQGIGEQLIAYSEEWAKKEGFKQIRTHSNNKAVVAINIWHKRNYGLCQHGYHRGDDHKTDDGRGYWVAKIL